MKKYILLFVFTLPIFSFSQNLKCKDFKSGQFTMTSDDFPNVKIKVIRNGDNQMEINLNPEILDTPSSKVYEKIEWLSDCKYKLLFDESKNVMDELSTSVNENGGIITEITKIEGKCCYYKSSLMFNGENIIVTGKFCKD